MHKVIHIVGARPNFVKMAPVYHALSKYGIKQFILHSGQHKDANLSQSFFNQLKLPNPDVNLDVQGRSYAEQTAAILIGCERYFSNTLPSAIIVYGDVNTTLAAAITTKKMNLKLIHVESGLRSFDNTMPEEINRKLVDCISDLLFVTERSGLQNLERESVDGKVVFIGNTMIDSLLSVVGKKSENRDSILMTFHRPKNVDTEEGLLNIKRILEMSPRKKIWPIHPRTKNSMQRFGMFESFTKIENLSIVEPMEYTDFVKEMQRSFCVITDSGGVQEETTVLGIPCITFRENTERPATIIHGTNQLAPTIIDVYNCINMLEKFNHELYDVPMFWDGYAGGRAAQEIMKFLGE